jgi:superfamily II DNA or RNA helicase
MFHLTTKPRDWQQNALWIWNGDKRGVVEVVTGGGKTFFAFMCIEKFFIAFPQGCVVIIVPTTALLDQWLISLQDDFHVPESIISTYSGSEKSDQIGAINIMVINTARTLAPQISTEKDCFLIVDECHRSGSIENSKALQGNHSATLGLSATPKREYDSGFEERVVPVLGAIIYRYGYEDAYRDGVITPFELVNIKTKFILDEEEKYRLLSKKAAIEYQKFKEGTGSTEKLEKLLRQRAAISSQATMRIPTTASIVEQNPNMRTIIFHERVDAANKIYSILLARGHRATIYHSKLGPLLRRDNLKLYRRGIFNVLVTCRALDEGMNVPETQLAIIASSTASSRQRIQRLGRVLRPSKDKDFARIYTIYITDQEERRLIKETNNLQEITQTFWYEAGIVDG